jgi:hypothetical protein
VVRQAVEDAASPLPAARLIRATERCALFLDREAGALL